MSTKQVPILHYADRDLPRCNPKRYWLLVPAIWAFLPILGEDLFSDSDHSFLNKLGQWRFTIVVANAAAIVVIGLMVLFRPRCLRIGRIACLLASITMPLSATWACGYLTANNECGHLYGTVLVSGAWISVLLGASVCILASPAWPAQP